MSDQLKIGDHVLVECVARCDEDGVAMVLTPLHPTSGVHYHRDLLPDRVRWQRAEPSILAAQGAGRDWPREVAVELAKHYLPVLAGPCACGWYQDRLDGRSLAWHDHIGERIVAVLDLRELDDKRAQTVLDLRVDRDNERVWRERAERSLATNKAGWAAEIERTKRLEDEVTRLTGELEQLRGERSVRVDEEWAVLYTQLHPTPVRCNDEAMARGTAAAGPGRVVLRRTVRTGPWIEVPE